MQGRHPALARITGPLLRTLHTQNSDQFGAAALRFEFELLRALEIAVQHAVTSPGKAPAAVTFGPSPGIAYQQMLDAAYDPAAALVVVTASMLRESGPIQGTFHNVIFGIADTLDRPAMWKDPYVTCNESRYATGHTIGRIRDVLLRLDFLKAPGVTFAKWVRDEIALNGQAQSRQMENDYGAMLHLVHTRLQQMPRR